MEAESEQEKVKAQVNAPRPSQPLRDAVRAARASEADRLDELAREAADQGDLEHAASLVFRVAAEAGIATTA